MNDIKFPTSLGVSIAGTIALMVANLPRELIGTVGFRELAYRLMTLREPTAGQTRLFEAVLVALANHGFTPTALSSRLTYLSAHAVQGLLVVAERQGL